MDSGPDSTLVHEDNQQDLSFASSSSRQKHQSFNFFSSTSPTRNLHQELVDSEGSGVESQIPKQLLKGSGRLGSEEKDGESELTQPSDGDESQRVGENDDDSVAEVDIQFEKLGIGEGKREILFQGRSLIVCPSFPISKSPEPQFQWQERELSATPSSPSSSVFPEAQAQSHLDLSTLVKNSSSGQESRRCPVFNSH